MENVGDDYETPGTLDTGENRVRGPEFSVVGNVTDDLSFVVAEAIMESEVRDSVNRANVGKRLSNFANADVFAQVRSRVPSLPALSVGAVVTYQSAMFTGQPDAAAGFDADVGKYTYEVPGYTTLNLFAHYAITERIGLRLNLGNVTDEDYYLAGYLSGSFVYIGDACNAKPALTYSFSPAPDSRRRAGRPSGGCLPARRHENRPKLDRIPPDLAAVADYEPRGKGFVPRGHSRPAHETWGDWRCSSRPAGVPWRIRRLRPTGVTAVAPRRNLAGRQARLPVRLRARHVRLRRRHARLVGALGQDGGVSGQSGRVAGAWARFRTPLQHVHPPRHGGDAEARGLRAGSNASAGAIAAPGHRPTARRVLRHLLAVHPRYGSSRSSAPWWWSEATPDCGSVRCCRPARRPTSSP